jgi:hypothetical protein
MGLLNDFNVVNDEEQSVDVRCSDLKVLYDGWDRHSEVIRDGVRGVVHSLKEVPQGEPKDTADGAHVKEVARGNNLVHMSFDVGRSHKAESSFLRVGMGH